MTSRWSFTHRLNQKETCLNHRGGHIGAMENFLTNSVLWILLIFLAIGLAYLIRAFFGYRRVSAEAQGEYEFRQSENALRANIDGESFAKAYRRVYAPRKAFFTGMSVTAVAVLTIPALVAMSAIGEWLWDRSGRPYDMGPETLVWQFMMFFAIIAFWGFIFYIAARIYHSRMPGSLEDELRKEVS